MKTKYKILLIIFIGVVLLVTLLFLLKPRSIPNKPIIQYKNIPPLERINFQYKKIPNEILILQQKPCNEIENNNRSYANSKNIDYLVFIPGDSKWQYINEVFRKLKYKYIMYIDHNMEIIDHNKDIRRLIQQGGDSDMIICRDEFDPKTVNLGSIIFRLSDWTLYKLKQLYWTVNDYEVIMDQIYTDFLPKYKLNDPIIDKGLPYLLSHICVYNEHAFNSSQSSFIDNGMNISNKKDIYPWKGVEGYVEIDKNFNPKRVSEGRSIPKNIFQTMETSLIPSDIYYNAQQKWKRMNPEYSYFFYDSLDRRNFIQNNYPKYVLDMYDKLLPGAYKSDLWRYCVLFKYGGCYVDIMMSPIKTLDSIIKNDDQFIASYSSEGDNVIDQGFLLTKPNHHILAKAIKILCKNVDYNYYGDGSSLSATGPILLGNVVNFVYGRSLSANINDTSFSDIKLLHHNHTYSSMIYNKEFILRTKNGNKWNLKYVPGWLEHYSSMYSLRKIFKKPLEDRTINFDWSNIGGIVYINLDHRTDRKKSIESELNKIGVPKNKITRLSATKHIRGIIGCAHSHMRACQLAIDNKWKNVLIFEDDFQFIEDKNTVNKLFNSLFNYVDSWDGVVLSASTINSQSCIYTPFMNRNLGSLTMSGYVVNKDMIPLLRENLQEAYNQLLQGKTSQEYACDVNWQKLHKTHKWYIFNPKIGAQLPSYSDIENKMVDYNA